jgi:hypothetical protein
MSKQLRVDGKRRMEDQYGKMETTVKNSDGQPKHIPGKSQSPDYETGYTGVQPSHHKRRKEPQSNMHQIQARGKKKPNQEEAARLDNQGLIFA